MTPRAVLCSRALAVACAAVALPAATQEGADREPLRRHALGLVNAARAEAGLAALSLGPVLTEAAQGHADDMAARGFYAHVAPDGETPRDRFRAAGGSRWATSGENIARCTGCATPPDRARVEAFHEGWMQSPEHREAILDEGFDRFGFAVAADGDVTYAVQTFAGPGRGDGDGPALDAGGAGTAALGAVNARRADEGLAPLEPSGTLDAVAARVLDARLAGEALPDDVFGLLPDGAAGWTSIAVRSASRGGSGAAVTRGDVEAFVEDWAAADADALLGGERAGHLGFAAATRDDGRATAVAVFGGRD